MQPLDGLGREAGDLLARVGVAGDRDHADARVADHLRAHLVAGPGDDVQDAGRQDLGRDLGQEQGGQGRPRRRLEDDGVAHSQRRAHLPAGHHDRVVPGRDRADDADRLAADHREVAGQVLVGRLALHRPGGTGEEAQVVDDDGNLLDGRLGRLACVPRFKPADLVRPRLDRVGEPQQHQASILGRRLRPRSRRRSPRPSRPGRRLRPCSSARTR